MLPSDLDLPAKFEGWRSGQWETIQAVADSDERASALCLPTGSGKSLTYRAILKLLDPLDEERACVLVSTRGLQDQVHTEFGEFTDLRGQQNYKCLAVQPGYELQEFQRPGRYGLMCDEGPCHAGLSCTLKKSGCLYADQYRRAHESNLVLSNFACYLSSYMYKQHWDEERRAQVPGLGTFDTLVLDEAHEAIDQLTNALSVELMFADIYKVIEGPHPNPGDGVELWIRWARMHRTQLEIQLGNSTPSRENMKSMARARRLLRTLNAICDRVRLSWVIEEGTDGVKFEPVHINDYSDQYLFRDTPRVILSSATITQKTLEMLGLSDATMYETPSPFPVANRMVMSIPTVRVDKRATEQDLRSLVERVDQIIGRRLDRKGIIHCTSYARMELVLRYSEHSNLMISHRRENAREQIAKFKARREPCILVSPSVTTGYDFPLQECEYQILLKIPYPDSRSKLMKARTEADKEYPIYLAMQTLVQTVGRGVRTPQDRCETFILDDHSEYFIPRNRRFAPAWFMQAYKRVSVIPAPPPKLNTGR